MTYLRNVGYTVLNQLVGEVAIALNQPKEKISVEMVFRSLYYVAKAIAILQTFII
ncbi:MAG: hypothetical protein KA717_21380 [Woronichinia naegeliana WA131]|uniref:Uncharacterized protein n=1 Tax=Woronichinia naegeliana WA131 TaxID=2824559 RepID=A0A977KS11_9CYAN|nr:MAG: hypothetical protein KA717_21380 [Woronichinia naegeliana WA131]